MLTLNEARGEIDIIDGEMKKLYMRRMETIKQIAEYKIAHGGTVYNGEREREVIAAKGADGCGELYKTIMRLSREYQYGALLHSGALCLPYEAAMTVNAKKVYYQGICGSYSSIAAQKMYPNAEMRSVQSFSDVVCEVLKGEDTVGILPLDNTTEGGINSVYDLLLESDVAIQNTVTIDVRHCLAAVRGSKLCDVKTVISHPQALAQCKRMTKNFNCVTSSNTALAAREVAQSGDSAIAAICSKEAAQLYGLEILQSDIQNEEKNATRFACIANKLVYGGDKISIALKLCHVSGALAAVLQIFSDYGINLTKIQSRPVPDSRWEYYFFIDFDGCYNDMKLQALLCQLKEETPYMKIMGIYGEVSA